MRRWLVAVVLVAVPAVAGAVNPLTDSWYRAQQALRSGEVESLPDVIAELNSVAEEFGVRTMPPYARALASWAANNPGEQGEMVLDLALRLDPSLSEAWFLQARWRWQSRQFPGAVMSYLRGWLTTWVRPSVRTMLVHSLGVWLLASVLLVCLGGVLLQSLRFLPRIYFDARRLSGRLFSGGNAIALAVVLVVLPLFAGLDPLWLLAYLFGLAWHYMQPAEKSAAGVVWLALVLMVPAMEWWRAVALDQVPLGRRVANVLDQRKYEPVTVQEFAELETELGESSLYRVLLGVLQWRHGDVAAAAVQFQKGRLADLDDPTPLVLLGNLAFEAGDVQLAEQRYRSAVAKDESFAIAHYNLSLTLDHNYHFTEADEERQKALEVGGEAFRSLITSRQQVSVLFPDVSGKMLAELIESVPQQARYALGLVDMPPKPLKWLTNLHSLAFFVTGVFGVALFLVRRKRLSLALGCVRCGKVFCPEDKASTESSTYCSQCISVFLKRGLVSIEQQAAKMNRIRAWERRTTFIRRATAVVFPGGGMVLNGQWWIGLTVTFFASLCLGLTFGWIPLHLRHLLPQASGVPIQVGLVAVFLYLWLYSIRRSWHRR
jgi:tetratricopeptide (TPR) repeat protein